MTDRLDLKVIDYWGVTCDTPGERCGCGQQYGHDELLRLPLAERRAA